MASCKSTAAYKHLTKYQVFRTETAVEVQKTRLFQSSFSNIAPDKVPYASLTLKNCEFKYFLKDYEALIYVENSILDRVNTLSSEPYLVQMGDDRGIRLKIENSSFMHSSFCKGMIVYREQPELLPYDTNYFVLNFKYESIKQINYDNEVTSENLPLIEISDSNFENLNQGRAITHLSFVEDQYHST